MEKVIESSNFACKDEEMAKLPDVNEEKLGINPYTQELVIECTKRVDPVAMVMDEDGIMIPATAVIEKQKAMKVYRYPGAKERAMNLSAGALRMFVYIQYTVKAGKDWIQMTPEQYARAVGKGGRNAYKNAKDELWRYGYIQPTVQKNVYWVNQCLMYAGDRIRKWPKNVVVKNTWAPDKEEPEVVVNEKDGEVNTNG
jgi:hypothetical protein